MWPATSLQHTSRPRSWVLPCRESKGLLLSKGTRSSSKGHMSSSKAMCPVSATGSSVGAVLQLTSNDLMITINTIDIVCYLL